VRFHGYEGQGLPLLDRAGACWRCAQAREVLELILGKITNIHSGTIVDDDLPLILPGEYTFLFRGHSTWVMFGRSPKLILKFSIIDDEMYSGVVLYKHYNVRKLKGRPGRNGNFISSRKSNFLRDLFRVCPAYPPKRFNRIPMSRLEGLPIQGKVKTVTKGFDQKDIPEPLQYSIITEIFR
jgi:hypothetical protein